MTDNQKYRLVTRMDFDGLVSAVLLKELALIDDIKFAHPKDMQDGKVPITGRDIITNLPYVPGAHLVFDHHASESLRNQDKPENYILAPNTPSAARVVYNYFGGKERFPAPWEEMMAAVDKADAAQFSQEDILAAQGWVLLNFIMDPRTGLGRFQDFRVSNFQLMMDLIEACRQHSVDEILALPDVQERISLYQTHQEQCKQQISECAEVIQNLVVLDLREQETIYAGNRFLVYALHPQCNISMHVLWGMNKQNTVFAVGKSILDRSSQTDIGSLMLEYGGGGHTAAGTCQIDNERAGLVQQELIRRITQDG